jgi:hypothetical protein
MVTLLHIAQVDNESLGMCLRERVSDFGPIQGTSFYGEHGLSATISRFENLYQAPPKALRLLSAASEALAASFWRHL